MNRSENVCNNLEDKLEDIKMRMDVMFVVFLIVLTIQTVLLFAICSLLSDIVR